MKSDGMKGVCGCVYGCVCVKLREVQGEDGGREKEREKKKKIVSVPCRKRK